MRCFDNLLLKCLRKGVKATYENLNNRLIFVSFKIDIAVNIFFYNHCHNLYHLYCLYQYILL